jgi:hypothetical protein
MLTTAGRWIGMQVFVSGAHSREGKCLRKRARSFRHAAGQRVRCERGWIDEGSTVVVHGSAVLCNTTKLVTDCAEHNTSSTVRDRETWMGSKKKVP